MYYSRNLLWRILAVLFTFNSAFLNAQTQVKLKPLEFTLQQAQDFAYENNYDLKNSATDVLIARKMVKQNTAIGLPQVNGEADYVDYLQIPTVLIPGFGALQMGAEYNLTGKLSLTQLIYSGQYLVGLQTAKAYLETAKQKNLKDKVDVRDQVANAYYMLLVADEAIKILDSTYVVVSRLVVEARKAQEQGLIEDIDVDQADLNRSNLEAQLTDTRSSRNVA